MQRFIEIIYFNPNFLTKYFLSNFILGRRFSPIEHMPPHWAHSGISSFIPGYISFWLSAWIKQLSWMIKNWVISRVKFFLKNDVLLSDDDDFMCLHISDDEDKPGIITLFFFRSNKKKRNITLSKKKNSEVETVKNVKSTNIDKPVNHSLAIWIGNKKATLEIIQFFSDENFASKFAG